VGRGQIEKAPTLLTAAPADVADNAILVTRRDPGFVLREKQRKMLELLSSSNKKHEGQRSPASNDDEQITSFAAFDKSRDDDEDQLPIEDAGGEASSAEETRPPLPSSRLSSPTQQSPPSAAALESKEIDETEDSRYVRPRGQQLDNFLAGVNEGYFGYGFDDASLMEAVAEAKNYTAFIKQLKIFMAIFSRVLAAMDDENELTGRLQGDYQPLITYKYSISNHAYRSYMYLESLLKLTLFYVNK
jgi:hypothetical protein